MNNFNTHVNLISIKVIDIEESEKFFDIIYNHLGLVKKDASNGALSYWGPFGLMIEEQKSILTNPEIEYKTGIIKISIRVPEKSLISNIFNDLKANNFNFDWEPRSFDYAQGYYSSCLVDPDGNKFEIVYTD